MLTLPPGQVDLVTTMTNFAVVITEGWTGVHVPSTRLERATSSLEGKRSIQLSYEGMQSIISRLFLPEKFQVLVILFL